MLKLFQHGWRLAKFIWAAEGSRQQALAILEYLGWKGPVLTFLGALATWVAAFFADAPAWAYIPVLLGTWVLLEIGLYVRAASVMMKREGGQRAELAASASTPTPSATPLVVDHDVWLSEAIDRAFLGVWGKKRTMSIFASVPEGYPMNVILNQIQQFGCDGKLPVWGKQTPYAAWEPIPPGFWTLGRVDIFSVLRSGERPEACNTEDNRHFSPRRFSELKTSRLKVDELWPVKN